MAKFKFCLSQKLSREAIIEVEAISLSEARENITSKETDDIPWQWIAEDIDVENIS
jgi:hypothetical protein